MNKTQAFHSAVLIFAMALPGVAAAQTVPAADARSSDSTTAAPAPRVKPHGPLFIRFYGGFVAGEVVAELSVLSVAGFTVMGGVAFPIAHREDMEVEIDLSYTEHSGGWLNPGGSRSVSSKLVGLQAHFLYNFVRDGRSFAPYVGGGFNVALGEVIDISTRSFPPFLQFGPYESRTTTLTLGPHAVGGVQFAAGSRITIRAEGRLLLNWDGPVFVALGGISF